VLLGLLGRQVTAGREDEPPFRRISNPNQPAVNAIDPDNMDKLFSLNNMLDNTRLAAVNYYPETGHTMRGAFKNYWEQNGGLFIYGFPISEEFEEANPSNGKVYVVQYFERNRFEYHPEFAVTKSEVLLGLLGNQLMVAKGWLQ
jgi:hypothetical protein